MRKPPGIFLLLMVLCFLFWGCTPDDPRSAAPSATLPAVSTILAGESTSSAAPSCTPSFPVTETAGATATDTKTASRTITPTSTVTPTRGRWERFYETAEDIPFSYIPPRGWSLQENPERTTSWVYRYGSGQEEVECELFFGVEFVPGTSAYEFLKIYYHEAVLLGSGKFEMLAGYDAYRFSFLDQLDDRGTTLTYYAITNGKYFVLAIHERVFNTCFDQEGAVDNSIKTLRFE